jgi:hypothetical protein
MATNVPIHSGMTSKKFVEGNDVKLYSVDLTTDDVGGFDGVTSGSEKFIGLVQSISLQDARGLPQTGELGSDKTITMIDQTQKSMQMSRLLMKTRSVLRAFYATVNNDENEGSGDKQGYHPDDIIGGDTIKIYASTELSDDSEETSSSVGGLFDSENMVGLVQNYSISSNLPISQVGEIGGTKKYLLSSKASKTINFNRIVSEDANVLKAFYHNLVGGTPLGGNMWTDLDHPIFNNPITIGIEIYSGNVDPGFSDPTVVAQIVLDECLPMNVSGASQQGTRGIADTISFKWHNTKYINGGDNFLIDLDNPECREPFNLMVEYTGDDGDAVTSKSVLEGCLVTSINHAISHGSRSTAETVQVMWESTHNIV